jgi:hypothetical protein
MNQDNSDDRVYAAERILKKRVKKVSEIFMKILKINRRQQQFSLRFL